MCCTTADHARLLFESEDVCVLLFEFGSVWPEVRARRGVGYDPSSDCFPEARRTEARGTSWLEIARTIAQQIARLPEAAKSPFQHALSTSVGSGCGGHSLPTLTDLTSNWHCCQLVASALSISCLSTQSSEGKGNRRCQSRVLISSSIPRRTLMMSWVEKTRRARAANKVTSSSPLFFKLGLHRTLYENPGVRGFLCAFLDDVYAVRGEPPRRRKDTDIEQRWRTFDASQLADQRRATETQWCDGETWFYLQSKMGLLFLEPSIGHDALSTALLLATWECANWAAAAREPSSGTSGEKTNTAVLQRLGSCVLIPRPSSIGAWDSKAHVGS